MVCNLLLWLKVQGPICDWFLKAIGEQDQGVVLLSRARQ